ncbi:MAG: type IV toxin-antitoxin system AbiEi family antitoxin [bacterium]|nr:type IV toxin-antitoxin system AbiEi family antitoxin [bacterium]
MNKTTFTSAASKGVSAKYRTSLTCLNRNMHGAFSIDDAANALNIPREQTAQLMPYLARRGWLRRVRNGIYITVPLEASDPQTWTEDPWIVLSRIFQPAYIGGWSAAHHWGLTDQLFRTEVIFTRNPPRKKQGELKGYSYITYRISDQHFFGTTRVWRSNVPVEVSDPSRTIIDILDTPACGGGIRHAAEILETYLESDYADEGMLLKYAGQLGNRTVYKRLGYLIEHLSLNHAQLAAECLSRRSRGISLLDPNVPPNGEINRRWEIRQNIVFEG